MAVCFLYTFASLKIKIPMATKQYCDIRRDITIEKWEH